MFERLFPGEGELARRMRGLDWTQTPFGDLDRWPSSLRSTLGICLCSNFPIAIYWGPALGLLYNDAWAPILGTKHPWALGRPGREVWPEIWDTIGPMFANVFATGQPMRAQDEMLPMHRHGFTEECWFDFTFTPILDADGAVAGIFNAVVETTFRHINERRTRTLRDLSERVFNAATAEVACERAAHVLADNRNDASFSAFYLFDDQGSARRVAHSGELTDAMAPARIPRSENSGSHWPLFEACAQRHGLDLPDLVERLGSAPASGIWPEACTQAVLMPFGPSPAEPASGVLVLGISPRIALDVQYRTFIVQVAQAVGSAIGAARAMESERARSQALAEIDRAKTVFFTNISHEFRTPLALMLGPLDDLAVGLDDPAQRTLAQTAQRNAQRLLKLVNSLLDFSRAEGSRTQARFLEIDLSVLTAQIASSFRSLCERAGLQLVVETPMAVHAFVDVDLWEKILLNLLSNAFKFTFEGAITVEVGADRKAHQAWVSVRDTGVGISRQDQSKLFQRFQRIEGAQGRSFEGSGIGLSLVQELVRLHGGSIAVESQIGRGTTFTIRLPQGSDHLPAERIDRRAAPRPRGAIAAAFLEEASGWIAEPQVTAMPAAAALSNATLPGVLLADDNADLRDYLSRLLAPHYTVEAVGDGEAAWTSLQQRRPALVISDVMMPGLDGFGLLARIRASDTLKTLPVMLLSARAGQEARIEGLAAGADDYLVKPFSGPELLERVAAHVALAAVRQQANEAVIAAEAKLRLALEASQAGVWAWNLQTGHTDWSPEMYALLGVDPAAADKTAAANRQLLPKDLAATRRRVREQLSAGDEVSVEFRVQPPGLPERWIHAWGRRVAPHTVVGMSRDITTRKQREQAAQDTAEKLRVAVVQLDQQITDMSLLQETALQLRAGRPVKEAMGDALAVALRLSGKTQGKVVLFDKERGDLELCAHQGLPEAFVAGIQRNPVGSGACGTAFQLGRAIAISDTQTDPLMQPWRQIVRLGGFRSALAVPLLARDGAALGVLTVFGEAPGDPDARERRLLDLLARFTAAWLEHHQQAQALQDSDRRKDQFLATLAHELRNPLAPVRNGLQLLQLRGEEGAVRAPTLDMMTRQVTHMVRLVDDLIEVSRISRGKIELRMARVDLATVVHTAIETVQPQLASSDLTLSTFLPDMPVWLQADPVRLAQVLSNVLDNAVKYTDRGGRIDIDAKRTDASVIITVKDTGIGIPAPLQPRVFDLFAQFDTPGRRGPGGLGIGLALVKYLVELHRGRVSVHSEGPGQGSEVRIELPVVIPESIVSPRTPTEAAAAVADRAQQHVMIVDDNQDAAESLELVLSTMGYRTSVAFDGLRALELIRQHKPAVVLLDLGMPGMDGYEVAETVRREPALDDVVLVALTGWSQADARSRSLRAGIQHHLVKPVESHALVQLLEQLHLGKGTAVLASPPPGI